MSETQQIEAPFNVHLDSPPVERWAHVQEDPRYFVSTHGRIMGPRGLRKPMMENGYPWFDVWVDGERRCIRVHRAMVVAFIPPVADKPFANHKNGRKSDNRIDNLEWCTHPENIKHSYDELGRTGLIGEINPGHKLTDGEVLRMRALFATGLYSKTELGRMFGLSQRGASMVIRREHWRHLP